MEFLPRSAGKPAGPAELMAAASGLEQALLLAARAAWQWVVLARLEEEPLALAEWLGQPVSLPLELLQRLATPRAQQAPEAQALSAGVLLKWEAPPRVAALERAESLRGPAEPALALAERQEQEPAVA